MEIIITGAAVTAILSFLGWVLIYFLIIRTARKAGQGVKKVFTWKQPLPESEPAWVRPAKVTKVRTVRIAGAPLPAEKKRIAWRDLKPNLLSVTEKAKTLVNPILKRAAQPVADSTLTATVGPQTYRVAKDGEELGSLTEQAIKKMIMAGVISPQDYYLDLVANEWKPLGCLPDLL